MKPTEHIRNGMKYAEERGMIPSFRTISSASGPVVEIEGRKINNFSSNNYLGLINDERMKAAVIEAVNKYGTGSSGSRLQSGNVDIHIRLEEEIADFKGAEKAIVFSSGYSCNVGTIAALSNVPELSLLDYLRPGTIIFSDALNHASIIDGARLSRRKVVVYRHNDPHDLERKMRMHPFRQKIVVTDGVFSMDGDMAKLDSVSALCRKYDATLYVDEAHATGVIGETGRGSCEHFGLKVGQDVHVLQGTCSKALAASGGFVVGPEYLTKYLRIMSRSYMFSTAMTPATSASILESLRIIREEPWRREQLQRHCSHLRMGLNRCGFDTLGSETQIIPVLIGEDEKTGEFSKMLFERGFFAPIVRWPAVPRGMGRLRLTCMTTHSREQIDSLIGACEEVGRKLEII